MASYMDPSLRQMKIYNMIVARSVGIAANVLLGWLVFKHTNKELRPYKKVLAITIFCDLNSSVLNILFNEVIFSYSDVYFTIFENETITKILSLPLLVIGSSIMIFFVSCEVSILPLHFIYRYLIIKHNYYLNYYLFVGIGLLCLWYPVYMMTFLMINTYPDESYRSFEEILMNSTHFKDKLPVFTAVSQPFMAKIVGPAIFGNLFIVYIIVIFCSVSMISKMKELKSSMSKTTLELQSQFTKILYVQAIIPFITSVIPILLSLAAFIITSPLLTYVDIPVFVITVWQSALNPICTILLMKSYRVAVFHYFSETRNYFISPAVSSSTSTLTQQ